MSKRPGEDLKASDPQKKQKVADLPTASSTTSKISYGSLKTASSSSSISYAALRKQQVSTMKAPTKPVVPATLSSTTLPPSSLQSANLAQLQNTTKQLSTSSSSTTQQQTHKDQESAATNEKVQAQSDLSQSQNLQSNQQNEQPKVDPSENKSEQKEGNKFSDSSVQQSAPKAINLKSQQQQILERAKKLKEEEMKLRILKKQEAVRKAVENTSKGIKPSSATSSSQQKTSQQLKDEQKAKEKKPLTKYELEIQQLQKYAMKKELEKKKIDHLIKIGKLKPEDLQKTQPKEELKIDGREIEIRTDDKGNLIDSKGNIVLTDSNKSTLKINQQKKQLDKLMNMKRNARFQKQFKPFYYFYFL